MAFHGPVLNSKLARVEAIEIDVVNTHVVASAYHAKDGSALEGGV
jgi:hypothetical protein